MKEIIIYEDNNIICLNKKAGIPSQPDKTGDMSLYDYAEEYLKLQDLPSTTNPHTKNNISLYIINRIDRPVSGIVLFAKNQEAANLYSKALNNPNTIKTYYAIVEKKPNPLEGELTDYLIKKNNKAYITNKKSQGKKASLSYKYIGSSNRYHFVEVTLKTGRFHQIRAQLSKIDCIIKGDAKYGAKRSNKDRSICLHARGIHINNPFTNKVLSLIAKFPDTNLWKVLEKTVKA